MAGKTHSQGDQLQLSLCSRCFRSDISHCYRTKSHSSRALTGKISQHRGWWGRFFNLMATGTFDGWSWFQCFKNNRSLRSSGLPLCFCLRIAPTPPEGSSGAFHHLHCFLGVQLPSHKFHWGLDNGGKWEQMTNQKILSNKITLVVENIAISSSLIFLSLAVKQMQKFL